MKKKVDIFSTAPLNIFTPPMVGTVLNLELSIGDIKACLEQGALVKEHLGKSGQTVALNFINYNKNNEPVQLTSEIEDKKEIAEEVKATEDVVGSTEEVKATEETAKTTQKYRTRK